LENDGKWMVSGVDFPGNKSIDNRKFTIKYYHKWAIPKNGWFIKFIMENLTNMNDLGVPPFQQTSMKQIGDSPDLIDCTTSKMGKNGEVHQPEIQEVLGDINHKITGYIGIV